MFFQLRRMIRVNSAIVSVAIRLLLYHVGARWDSTNYERFMRAGADLLTKTLEDLGATYVKLGQVLAMRPDFLPLPYIEELSRLLDDVRPFPTPEAIRILEQDLGQRIHDCFQVFPDAPIASASFGQVYRAELRTGELVAIKVRRPGIERVVRADLRVMKVLSWVVDLSTVLMTVSMRDFYAEFKSYTAQELDYKLEARHIHRIRKNVEGNEIERIPRVHWELTTSRVLCLEFLEGIWVNEILAALNAGDEERLARWRGRGLDLELVSVRLLYVLMKQAFVDGFFHADPHAANIVVMDGNVIGLVDFGIIGTLGGDYQKHMFQFMRRVGERSPSGAFAAILRVLMPSDDVDLRSFKHEYESNMQSWLEASGDPTSPISEKTAAKLIVSQLSLIRRYRLHLPPAVSRFYRALLIADSVAIQLSPQIDVATEMGKIVSRLSLENALKQVTLEGYLQAFLGYQNMLLEVPRMFAEIAESRALESALRTVRSFDTGVLLIKRRLTLVAAYLLKLGALTLGLLTFVTIWKGRQGPSSIQLLASTVGLRYPATTLLVGAAGFLWFARRLRISVGARQ